ncbi:uncharacterized protein LOC121267185 [Juglans microcarpa x Juglans regia]|uniref:uncharacterized protein LOC121267185 n=1 Tax=Juglans microcarpa x Juglans regia TaxID=2249226 RepID=UPI001B7E2BE0|nr:uncharacterized protein LOC121267185 [Juglans microcarpa x Juglans regia]
MRWRIWRRLKLNDEEEISIEVQKNMLGLTKGKGERSLVGKVLSDHRIGREVVRSMMEKVWKVGKPLKFHDIGSNCFVITFVNRRDKMRVLSGCPWLFDNHLFVLKDFDGEMQPNKIDFDHACLWIQMLNLHLSYLNKEMGELIGRSMGEVMEVDVQEDGLAWGRCLRVRVECDLRRPLA